MSNIPVLSDAGTPVPSTVVTLVHGTFGRDAAWTLPNSAFRAHLQRHLGAALVVERFAWSGVNSHAARVRASDDLAAHQRVLFERYPMATHAIVAHSHGGNVASYALRDPFVRARLSSLITIGTPFITCRPRRTPESIDVLTIMAGDFLAAVAACAAAAVGVTAAMWLTPLTGTGGYRTALEITTWGIAVLVPLVLLITLARRLPKSVAVWYQALLRAQESGLARLSLPRLENVRVLSIAVRVDEADWYLRFLVHISNVPSWLFHRMDSVLKHWFEDVIASESAADRLINYFGLFLMPTAVAAFFLLAFMFDAADTADLARVVLNINIGLVLLLTPLLIVAAASAQFLMVVLPRVVRAHRLGFGDESLLDNWLANIGIWREPTRAFAADQGNCTFVCLGSRELGGVRGRLSHSQLCESPAVADTIGRWLAGEQIAGPAVPFRSSWSFRLRGTLGSLLPEGETMPLARQSIKNLLLVNATVFFVVQPLFHAVSSGVDAKVVLRLLFGLDPDDTVWGYYLTQVWSLSPWGIANGPELRIGPLTYMWWHDEGWRLFFDMWVLFAFGGGIELLRSGGSLLACYLAAGYGAAFVVVALHSLIPLPLPHDGPVAGATAASLGVMAACAWLSPNRRPVRCVPLGAKVLAPTLAALYAGSMFWMQSGHRLLFGAAGLLVGTAYALFRRWRARRGTG